MKFVRIEAPEFNAALEASGKHLEDLLEDGIPQATLEQLSTKGGRIAVDTALRIDNALGLPGALVPPATPKIKPKRRKCAAKTRTGQPCSNSALVAQDHCGHHQPKKQETVPAAAPAQTDEGIDADLIKAEVNRQVQPMVDGLQRLESEMRARATDWAQAIDNHVAEAINNQLPIRLEWGLQIEELAQRTDAVEIYVKSTDDRITELGKRFDLIGQELARLLVALKSSDGPVLLRTALQAILQSNEQTGADEIRAIIELSAELRQWGTPDPNAPRCDWVSADGNLCDRAPVPGASVCARHLEIQNRLEEP